VVANQPTCLDDTLEYKDTGNDGEKEGASFELITTFPRAVSGWPAMARLVPARELHLGSRDLTGASTVADSLNALPGFKTSAGKQ
jgi:hypothetical protein